MADAILLFKPNQVGYVQMADKLFEQNKISSGKYDELMLAGFRSDIVYGDEEDDQIDD